jgi:small-conductance mechanosensitive channel
MAPLLKPPVDALLQDGAPVRILSHSLSRFHPWFVYGTEIGLLIVALGIVRFVVVHFLRRWARRKTGAHHSEMVDVLAQGLTPILLVLLLEAAFSLLDIPRSILGKVDRGLNIVVLVLVLYFLSKVLQVFLNRWITRAEKASISPESVQFFTKVIFAVVATLLVLENLDVQLKTIWTTVGIGGVAVALALQDTLSNFFAGLYLRLDNPVQLGDYVLLEGSQEGFVRELGWRSARMQTLNNTTVIIPNGKLASTVLINFSAVNLENSVVVNLKITHDADPERVKSVLSDAAAKASQEITGCDQDSSPWVRYIGRAGQPMDDYAVIVRLCNDADPIRVERQIRERLLDRLASEHIKGAPAPPSASAQPGAAPSAPPAAPPKPQPPPKSAKEAIVVQPSAHPATQAAAEPEVPSGVTRTRPEAVPDSNSEPSPKPSSKAAGSR